MPPLAASVAGYAEPTAPFGRAEGVVIVRGGRAWLEYDIDPIVGAIPGLCREDATRAVGINTVPSRHAIGQRVQRSIIHPIAREVALISAVVTGIGVVGCHINRVLKDRDRRKVHLLPPRCRLTRECGCRKLRAAARPQVAYVRARVGAGFVESNSGNGSCHVGAEFQTQALRDYPHRHPQHLAPRWAAKCSRWRAVRLRS